MMGPGEPSFTAMAMMASIGEIRSSIKPANTTSLSRWFDTASDFSIKPANTT
eukprot:gene12645-14617_t